MQKEFAAVTHGRMTNKELISGFFQVSLESSYVVNANIQNIELIEFSFV